MWSRPTRVTINERHVQKHHEQISWTNEMYWCYMYGEIFSILGLVWMATICVELDFGKCLRGETESARRLIVVSN